MKIKYVIPRPDMKLQTRTRDEVEKLCEIYEQIANEDISIREAINKAEDIANRVGISMEAKRQLLHRHKMPYSFSELLKFACYDFIFWDYDYGSYECEFIDYVRVKHQCKAKRFKENAEALMGKSIDKLIKMTTSERFEAFVDTCRKNQKRKEAHCVSLVFALKNAALLDAIIVSFFAITRSVVLLFAVLIMSTVISLLVSLFSRNNKVEMSELESAQMGNVLLITSSLTLKFGTTVYGLLLVAVLVWFQAFLGLSIGLVFRSLRSCWHQTFNVMKRLISKQKLDDDEHMLLCGNMAIAFLVFISTKMNILVTLGCLLYLALFIYLAFLYSRVKASKNNIT